MEPIGESIMKMYRDLIENGALRYVNVPYQSIIGVTGVAFKIMDCCISCWACEPMCSTGAIYANKTADILGAMPSDALNVRATMPMHSVPASALSKAL